MEGDRPVRPRVERLDQLVTAHSLSLRTAKIVCSRPTGNWIRALAALKGTPRFESSAVRRDVRNCTQRGGILEEEEEEEDTSWQRAHKEATRVAQAETESGRTSTRVTDKRMHARTDHRCDVAAAFEAVCPDNEEPHE
ncbi:hypothetical protein MTO96_025230 [Rhipicephalus appendiculatus]